MRTLARNQKTIYYCLRTGRDVSVDEELTERMNIENGDFHLLGESPVESLSADIYEDGDDTTRYETEAHPLRAYVSSAGGMRVIDRFGSIPDYDRTIITNWVGCPIDENSVLFVEKSPEFGDNGEPIYDYVVVRVSRELNHTTYYIKRVEVGR